LIAEIPASEHCLNANNQPTERLLS